MEVSLLRLLFYYSIPLGGGGGEGGQQITTM
jgi:hypothetical protein